MTKQPVKAKHAADNQAPDKHTVARVWWSVAFFIVYFFLFVAPLTLVVLPLYLPRRTDLWTTVTAIITAKALLQVLALIIFILFLSRTSLSLATVGWRPPVASQTIAQSLLVTISAVCVFAFIVPTLRTYGTEVSPFKVYGVAAASLLALSEEFFFRGYLMGQMSRLHISSHQQIWISGIAQGLFLGIMFGWGLVVFLILSLYWANLYKKEGSLTPCIAGHLLLNLLLEPWMTLHLVHQFTRLYP